MADYYHEDDLGRLHELGRNAPELWQQFQTWYSSVFAEGALTAREKSVVALAVAHALESPYLIDAYTEECVEHGVSMTQMTEAVHVAAALRSGTTLMHGLQMRRAAGKIEGSET
ncbi:MAG: arsenosugar biosynthesis-associated peroxidase-like protein [Bryobacteraceae bacterium]